MGFVAGLDAVVTQNSNQRNAKQTRGIYSLSKDIVELQTLILGFLFIILTLHTEYIISLLFADRIDQSIDVAMIVICFLMLMTGMIARGMSEGWMSILTGLGKIKSYARPVLLGALLNPLFVIIIGKNYEMETGLYYICFIFLSLNIFFHMYVVPKVTATALEVTTFDLVKPVLLPIGLTVIAILLAHSAGRLVSGDLWKLLLTIAIASCTVGLYFLVRITGFFRKQAMQDKS